MTTLPTAPMHAPGSTYAATVKAPINSLGGAFMISRYAKAAADEQGLVGAWTSYFAGRGGVLGAVDADVVTAAFGFYPADTVRVGWEAAWMTTDPARAAARYTQACHEWGRARLQGFTGAARLAELAGTVAATADVAGLPLFAAWGAVPLPLDAPARAAQALHVLREHRGGLHLVAVVAAGLTPLQAILAGPGGAANAGYFGWTGPYQDVAFLAAERVGAEVATDLLADRAYLVLDTAEQAELADLLGKAVAHAFPRATLDGP